MITFIASHPHLYTFAALRREVLRPVVPETRAITYDDLFAAERLPQGTYVFTDMERLHPAELRLAARYYRLIGALAGFRVVNDPAKVKTRYALLRALAAAGLNDFDVYCADGLPQPRRFPVLLRTASDHAGPIGDLIHDQTELDARLAALEAEGIPLVGVLVIEFCGERNADGLHEKLAFFRIGDRVTLAALLIGTHWTVKIAGPSLALVTPEVMRDQLEAIRTDRFAADMRQAFEIAGIEYGRADVGFRNGRLQVYEINTNPNITASDRFTSDEHRESRLIYRARFGAMLHAIDTPAGIEVAIDPGPLDRASLVRRDVARAVTAARSAAVAAEAAAVAEPAQPIETGASPPAVQATASPPPPLASQDGRGRLLDRLLDIGRTIRGARQGG